VPLTRSRPPSLRPRRHGARRGAPRGALVAYAASLLAAGAAAGACEPCAGIVACRGAPRVSIGGRFIERWSGRPIPGVVVELVPVGGVALPAGSARAVSDGAGQFQLGADAAAAGEITADVIVTPPAPYRPYRVRGLTFRTSEQRGEGAQVGTWVVDPFVSFLAEVRNRRTDRPIVGATVTAIRSAGVAVDPARADVATDGSGRFLLTFTPDAVGDAVFDFLIAAPGVTRGTWVRGVRLAAEYRDIIPDVNAVFRVGISLEYQGEIVFRGTGQNLTAGEVEFRRTGGIEVVPAAVTATIAPNGRFALSLNPSDEGEVVGDLIVTRPGAAAVRIPGVRLATYDSNAVRLQRFAFGEQFLYVGEVYHRGLRGPADAVVAQFRRTGGVAIEPGVLGGVTGPDGRFPLRATVTDSGDVIGDLVLRDVSGDSSVYRDVRIRTFAADELRLAGVWGVGEHLSYVGELWSNTTRRPAPGVTVEFRRTGGIAVSPDRFTAVTNEAGRFALSPRTRERGEVAGDLLVRADGAERPVATVRLRTFNEDETRLAGVWGFGPSLFYVGEVLRTDVNLPVVGARVEIVRTGGIEVEPERATATTDAGGRFPISMTPRSGGELVARVTVRPAAPWPDTAYVFDGVRAATFETGDLRLLTVLRIPPPPR
jgi:hypothetical protein